MERARDALRACSEVDRDRVCFHPDDAAHAVRVVIDQVPALELLDDRLRVRLEGAVGEMPPPSIIDRNMEKTNFVIEKSTGAALTA